MIPLGTLVINEWVFPIFAIRLKDGMLHLLARVDGPFPAFKGARNVDYEIFGEDGRSIGHLRQDLPGWGDVTAGGGMVIHFPIELSGWETA